MKGVFDMAIILLLVLSAAEIGLVAFEWQKEITKREWSAHRLYACVGELLLYLGMLILPGIDFGFRFKLLAFLLVLRCLVSGILRLCSRKNDKRKRKGTIAAGAVFGIFVFLLSLLPAFLFADYNGRPLTGEYEVKECSAILTDPQRAEEFEQDGSGREVPIHFYYPEDSGQKGLHSLPLVIFSHGAFGYYQSNTSTYRELASHGFVVISLDHPYHSFFTKDTDGKIITVNPEFLQTALEIGASDRPDAEIFPITSQWMKLRTEDMNFVLDTVKEATNAKPDERWYFPDGTEKEVLSVLARINPEKIGLIGHSLGGATAVTVGRREDISAVIDLDGTMLGEELGMENGKVVYNEQPYPTPILDIRNEEHYQACLEAEKKNEPYVNNIVMNNAANGFVTHFQNSGHMNFTDLPLFAPALAEKLGTGKIDPVYCVDQMNEIAVSFLEYYLKGQGTFEVEESYSEK